MTRPAQTAAETIKARSALEMVEAAIILGHNFAGVADIAENPVIIRYAELPGFPQIGPAGDERELIIGAVDGIPTVFLKGCANFYETGDPSLMARPIETLTHLGVRSLLSAVTAVSVSADLMPSSLVAIIDHINFNGLNPLVGAGGDNNFVNMTEAYDKRLQRRLKLASSGAGITLREGVFMWFSGPSFETPAEVKMARLLGADLLGPSLVPEAILARRFSLPFAGVAVISDYAAGFSGGNPTHDLSRGHNVAGVVALKRLVRAYVKAR
ncbi:MAG: purine-nucleoside phosphorylase [Methylocystis sp.]|nr:purine-nucleoside phosphorylase [Methylocystis sp.]